VYRKGTKNYCTGVGGPMWKHLRSIRITGPANGAKRVYLDHPDFSPRILACRN
jgi:hypothetical protein